MNMRALFLCLFVASCGYPGYYGGSGDNSDYTGDQPEQEGFISGRVVNAQTGQPVEGALVSTSPPTGTTTTNSQGTYSLLVPPLSRSIVVGVVADQPGLRQRQSSCATVSPGGSVSADVQLLSNNATECASSCSEGNICLGGICASACNPVCDCDERCEDGRCVPDASGGSLPVDQPPSGGGGTTGCGADAVSTPNGCVEKPLLGSWTVTMNLTLDMDGVESTLSDRTEASFTWQFEVFNVEDQNSGPLWRGQFGGGRLVSMSGGDRFTSASSGGAHPQDRCSGNEELTGLMTLTAGGDLVISNEVGTGLVACARVDGGPATQVLTLTRSAPVSRSGYSNPVPINNGSWAENPTNITVLNTSGSASINR